MKKVILSLVLLTAVNAYALGDQQIINPFTGNGVWILAQRDCNNDPNKGTIYAKGQILGCWWTNLVKQGELASEVYFSVDGQTYVFPQSKIDKDINSNNARGLPWQTLMEINNMYRSPAPAYRPSVNTYYYGAGDGYVGRSTSF